MSFIQSIPFKAELTKPAVMDFIGRTPTEAYFMIITGDGTQVYGIVTDESTIEYLTNEFAVKSIEFIPLSEVKQSLTTPGCRKTGSIELLDL